MDDLLSTVALGLAAWNQGVRHSKKLSALIWQSYADGTPLKDVVTSIGKIERLFSRPHMAEEKLHEAVTGLIGRVQGLLGIRNGVAIVSKFLHFLSPRWFPILDRNVMRGLRRLRSPTNRDYVEFTLALRALGYGGKLAKKPIGFARRRSYLSGRPGLSAVRAVECALFRRGRQRSQTIGDRSSWLQLAKRRSRKSCVSLEGTSP